MAENSKNSGKMAEKGFAEENIGILIGKTRILSRKMVFWAENGVLMGF
jgi:hypothetical protein